VGENVHDDEQRLGAVDSREACGEVDGDVVPG